MGFFIWMIMGSFRYGKKYINSFPFDDEGVVIYPDQKSDEGIEYQKPFECSPDDTIITGTITSTTDIELDCSASTDPDSDIFSYSSV